MRISDWSSDVCSSDLHIEIELEEVGLRPIARVADRFDRPKIAYLLKPAVRIDGLNNALQITRDRIYADAQSSRPQGNGTQDEARSDGRRVGKECVST